MTILDSIGETSYGNITRYALRDGVPVMRNGRDIHGRFVTPTVYKIIIGTRFVEIPKEYFTTL